MSFFGRFAQYEMRKFRRFLKSIFMLAILISFVVTLPYIYRALFLVHEEPSITIIIFGDTDHKGKEGWHDDVFEGVVRESREAHPAFSIMTGDQISAKYDMTSNCTEYYRYVVGEMEGTSRPWYAVEGNHDVETSDGRSGYLQYLSGSEYYMSSLGGCLFVFLSSELANASGEVSGMQYEWLAGVLRNSTHQYKFVFVHRPPYDYSSSDVYPSGHGWLSASARDRFGSLMTETNVTAVFSGHQHMYRHIIVGGVHYITTGAAGSLYNSSQGLNINRDEYDDANDVIDAKGYRYQIPTASMESQGVFYNYVKLKITSNGAKVFVYRADAPYDGGRFYVHESYML